jgi:hypothetical protein
MESAADQVRQELKLGKTLSIFRVVTDSMAPLIPVGSRIAVAPLPAGGVRALKTFDIVLTDYEDKLFCHYLAYVSDYPDPDGNVVCMTRGLNNVDNDFPIPESKVLGQVVSHRITWRYKLRIAARVIRAKVASRIQLGKENPPLP